MAKRNGRRGKTRVFEVVVKYDPKERGPYKFTVDVPALPGCFSEGRTREEALENIKEAIALMLETAAQPGREDRVLVEVRV